MAKEILIVEDEGLIAGLLSKNLSQKGYDIAVLESKLATAQARWHKPSLVILDAPSSALEVAETCRTLHEATSVPIIALTDLPASLNDMDGVTYLSKPPDFRELLGEVESALSRRRKRRKRTIRILCLGELSLDLETRQLTRGESCYRLTPKEFLLLKMFMSHPGQVLSHKAIMKEVWDTNYVGDTRTLYVHVSWIRQKIEDKPSKPTVLRTVRGVGYRFEAKP
jgi:DNA-binding response OmpR family regulator